MRCQMLRCASSCCRRSQREHSIGVSVSDTSSEIMIAATSVIENSRNSRSTMPPMNRIEMNTATSARFIESSVVSRPPLRADDGGLERRLAQLDVARDVLEHHDRVVDDQARRDDERHQREVVEREAAQVHHGEAADERHRHGRHRDDRRAQAGEEQQDDQDDEHHGDEQRPLGLVQRGADGGRAVAGDRRAGRRPAGRRAAPAAAS